MPKKSKKIETICLNCKSIIKCTEAKPRKYCNKNCKNIHSKELFKGKNNPAYGKTYRSKKTHPEWVESISKTMIERQINVGEKNAMKRKEVAKKMSKTRRKKVTSNEQYLQNLSKKIRELWENGRYENVNVGQCKWFDYVKNDGTVCKVQGTWELKYVEYLDNNGIEFLTHKGRIEYKDDNGEYRSYYPDFFLPNENKYIDVKNDYHFELGKRKFELIFEQNQDLNIIILTKKDLIQLGIEI
jgi:hypothetical protein